MSLFSKFKKIKVKEHIYFYQKDTLSLILEGSTKIKGLDRVEKTIDVLRFSLREKKYLNRFLKKTKTDFTINKKVIDQSLEVRVFEKICKNLNS